MTYHAQHAFGQAGGCVLSGPARIDKWHLIDALTQAADSFGIGHRQIGVLKALISFHTQRHWPVTADTLVVYPSNRTLCARLGGMPDSTLRRHLARLVAAGLITRHASSNGNRFRRGRGADEVAFGLDLAPLVRLSATIQRAARTARDTAEAIAAQRATLLSLRQQLITRGGTAHQTFLADLGRALRRKLSLDTLKSLLGDIRARLSAVPQTQKTSGSDSENERHIEPQDIKKTTPPSEPHTDLTPTALDAICQERRSLFPDPLRQWSDVIRNADAVAPMLGITAHTLNRARQRHGPVATAIAILYVLEMHSRIDHPDAYLRQLIQRADMAQTVQEALHTGKLSADNPKMAINTIG